MSIFYELAWLWQRFLRRKIGIAKISKLSISINQVGVSVLAVSNSLRDKRVLTDYKKPLNAHSEIVQLHKPVLNPKTGVIWIKRLILAESSVYPISKLLKWEPSPFFFQKVSNTSINLPDNGYYHFVIEDLPRFYEAFMNQQFSQVVIGSKSKYSKKTSLMPNIIFQYQQGFMEINLGTYVKHGNLTFGAWYRNRDAFILSTGI